MVTVATVANAVELHARGSALTNTLNDLPDLEPHNIVFAHVYHLVAEEPTLHEHFMKHLLEDWDAPQVPYVFITEQKKKKKKRRRRRMKEKEGMDQGGRI